MAIQKVRTSTVATTNHTLNYDLPLWNGEDVTSWQGNLNDAFNKIDTAIYEVQKNADSLKGTEEEIKQLFDEIKLDNETIRTAIDGINTTIDGLNGAISQLRIAQTEANTAIQGLSTDKEAIMAQIDTMQDDIGLMMNYASAVEVTFNEPYVLDDAGSAIVGAVLSPGTLMLLIDFEYDDGTPQSFMLYSDAIEKIKSELNINSDFIIYYTNVGCMYNLNNSLVAYSCLSGSSTDGISITAMRNSNESFIIPKRMAVTGHIRFIPESSV